MSYAQTPSTSLAKSTDASSFQVPRDSVPTKVPLLAAQARPEDVFRLLRQLIAEDQVGTARSLLAEAVRRFPEDVKIRQARSVLAEGKATLNPFVQPTVDAEIEWLKDPPKETRGKWVALIGSEVVGIADSAQELMASLRSKNLVQLPVAQYIAP